MLLGFDAADRLGGGPAYCPGVVAAEVDGHDLGGDVDGDDLAGVDPAQGDFLPATMMTPVLLATRWTVTGSVKGRGGGPAGRAPRSSRAWSQVSGLARVPAGPGGGVEEHQRGRLDPDGHHHAAEDLRGGVVAAAEADMAVFADHPVDLYRSAGLGRRTGGGPAGRPPPAARRAGSAADRCERTDLTRAEP